jgi:rod shape-determining protein MreD
MQLSKIFFLKKIISSAPIILLFISVLNEFDFNYLNFKYFSFNFPYILIFYWSLKGGEKLGYGLVFLAGLINDVVVGLPIGISSVLYLLICGFASYLRNITLRPSLVKDWFFFLFTISVVTTIFYIINSIFFLVKVDYYYLLFNVIFTFIFYYMFSIIFSYYSKFIGKEND